MALFIRPIEPDEIKEVEPFMLGYYSSKVETLCDHIRVIYRAALDRIDDNELRDFIMGECKKCMVYAKRMDTALKKYKQVNEYEL